MDKATPAGVHDIIVYGERDEIPENSLIVNPTSRSRDEWSKALSPFFLGPIPLYGTNKPAHNLENAWQYAKVYQEHARSAKIPDAPPEKQPPPSAAYFAWAKAGWDDVKPQRFPMGRGAIPLYSYWNGEQLGYVEARHKIYAPLYAAAVEKTDAWVRMKNLYEKAKREGRTLAIFDFDGHNSLECLGSYEQVFYNHQMKMGHGFVLAMMLENQRIWEQPYDASKVHWTKVPKRRLYSQTLSTTTIFVSGFPSSTTEQMIASWFKDYKVVSTSLKTKRDGTSKGFAFVTFELPEEQQRALAEFNMDGINVRAAYDPPPKEPQE